MRHDSNVLRWLWLGTGLIACMVVVGGVTRLTGSGLSITRWDVVMGSLPPLTDAAWDVQWTQYQASPQFAKVNSHFTLQDFKGIFFWEWFHRLLGRVVGLTFILPWLYFWRRGRLERWLKQRGAVLAGLIAFQGLLGWLMVKSGLVDEPRVSHFRLAAHLLTALGTMGLSAWTALRAAQVQVPSPRRALPVWLLLALVTLQITFGAFTAGLKAGFLFNTFPTMGGVWVSPLIGELSPWWVDVVNNPATVQFVHRWLGVLVVLAAALAVQRVWRVRPARREALWLGLAVVLQFNLGVVTILFFPEAPVLLGALHQAGATFLLAVGVVAAFRLSSVATPAAAPAAPAAPGAVAQPG